MSKNILRSFHLVLVTDCGGSDRGRYEIAARRSFWPKEPQLTFFGTQSMNTLHAGFTTAAHALSTIDHFGPIEERDDAPFFTIDEKIGILDNAAPRHGTENGKKLRGDGRKGEGEEIYALLLDNNVWVVGPNAGLNFYFIQSRIRESYLVTDTSGMTTPFRSMEVMVPTLAKVLGARDHKNIELTTKPLIVPEPEQGIFVADWDEHGNLYVVSIGSEGWVPALGEYRVFRVGEKIARLRHVDGIFAGQTGEPTLTTGSLKLNGQPVHYLVVVGSSAQALFGYPPIGAKVVIEE
ncbi:MAG: hypothetical protein M1383_05020 [Patescibacteria group bacterium]|nr:hypothetical protein [Patescibacteria group bacterium]